MNNGKRKRTKGKEVGDIISKGENEGGRGGGEIPGVQPNIGTGVKKSFTGFGTQHNSISVVNKVRDW